MALDYEMVKSTFPQAVPMVATLKLEFDALDDRTAVMTLRDQDGYRNHIGGPHAGAMFTLGESASGALVLTNFGDKVDQATPLVVESTIRYLKVAKGDITATATLSREAAEVLAELADGKRPEFRVDIELHDAEGTQTGEMMVLWTLRPNRP